MRYAPAALEELCRRYWFPVYAYIRRRGNGRAEAEDLTQSFFLRLIERQTLAGIRREGGRFRSFLLTATENFLANDFDRRCAQKRGGGVPTLSLDAQDSEGPYAPEEPEATTPAMLFEKRWAFTLLDLAMERLSRKMSDAGKGDVFAALRGHLLGDDASPAYAEVGRVLGMSEGAVKVAVHRLRARYGAELREVVAETVTRPEEIDDELRYLIRIVRQ